MSLQPGQGHCASQTGWRCNPSSRQPGFQGKLRPGPECKGKPFWATSRRARVEEGTFAKQSHACFRFFYGTQGRGTCEALYVCVTLGSFQSRGHHTLLTASPDTPVGEPTAPDLEKRLTMEEVWILDSGAGSCQVRPIGNLGHSCPVIPSSSGHGNSSRLKAVGHNHNPAC